MEHSNLSFDGYRAPLFHLAELMQKSTTLCWVVTRCGLFLERDSENVLAISIQAEGYRLWCVVTSIKRQVLGLLLRMRTSRCVGAPSYTALRNFWRHEITVLVAVYAALILFICSTISTSNANARFTS